VIQRIGYRSIKISWKEKNMDNTSITMRKTSLPIWLLMNAAALAFTLAHVLIDFQIGLFGETSLTMTPLQAANAFITSLVFASWSASMAMAASGSSKGYSATFALVIGWAILSNGLVAVFAAPPPSAAFPYQDITHFGSLIFGGLGAYAVWREMRRLQISFERRAVLTASTVLILIAAAGSVLALSFML
jgi:hypothetical protein